MRLWIKKITVVLITMMTLGIYAPQAQVQVDAEDNKDTITPNARETSRLDIAETEFDMHEQTDKVDPFDEHTAYMSKKAKEQALMKLGPKITNKVDKEFTSVILPKIEQTIETILNENEDEALYYDITEEPSNGYGERIFNITDMKTNRVIAKFHVRRDNRPLEGYWFNFHYHLANDGFTGHHDIGEIYWDKNMPPKWMAH